jgi:hypothetical protein
MHTETRFPIRSALRIAVTHQASRRLQINTAELGTSRIALSLSLSLSLMTVRLQNFRVRWSSSVFALFSSNNSVLQRLPARTATAAVAVLCAELHVQKHLLLQSLWSDSVGGRSASASASVDWYRSSTTHDMSWITLRRDCLTRGKSHFEHLRSVNCLLFVPV